VSPRRSGWLVTFAMAAICFVGLSLALRTGSTPLHSLPDKRLVAERSIPTPNVAAAPAPIRSSVQTICDEFILGARKGSIDLSGIVRRVNARDEDLLDAVAELLGSSELVAGTVVMHFDGFSENWVPASMRGVAWEVGLRLVSNLSCHVPESPAIARRALLGAFRLIRVYSDRARAEELNRLIQTGEAGDFLTAALILSDAPAAISAPMTGIANVVSADGGWRHRELNGIKLFMDDRGRLCARCVGTR
jgi:hypothetical protein